MTYIVSINMRLWSSESTAKDEKLFLLLIFILKTQQLGLQYSTQLLGGIKLNNNSLNCPETYYPTVLTQ